MTFRKFLHSRHWYTSANSCTVFLVNTTTWFASYNLHLPIALRNGTHSYTQYHITFFVSYDIIHHTFLIFCHLLGL